MSRLRTSLSGRIAFLLGVAVLVAAVVEGFLIRDEEPAWALLLPVAWSAPLLVAPRVPVLAVLTPALMVVAGALEPDLVYDSIVALAAGILAFWNLGTVRDRRVAVLAALASFAMIAAMVQLTSPEANSLSDDMVFLIVVVVSPWVAARTLQGRSESTKAMALRAERLERDREERAARAAEEERRRIARELHDVIAHAVATMTVQATGARLVLATDPARAREPIEAIEATGREALAEMRRMVGVLRAGDETGGLAPQPGLRGIDRLVADLRDDGYGVSLVTSGEPPVLSPGLDLTAYRVVEEALDNVRAYTTASHARVTVTYEVGVIELVVENDGGAGPGSGGGHPLAALHERVELYDGSLTGNGLPGGGYRVVARLPIEGNP